MTNKIKEMIETGFIVEDHTAKNLTFKHLKKARMNLITMSLLSEFNSNKKVRDILKIPYDYDSDEWIVICGYYAMYSAALALLANIGFKSKNHSATIQVLEEYFVKKSLLDKSSFLSLKNAILQKEELEKLSEVKHKKEIAQYSVTKKTTKEIASKIKQDAYSFTGKVELIIKQLK